jgi:hypothetical protein
VNLSSKLITQIVELNETNGEKNADKDLHSSRLIIITFPCFRAVLGAPSDKAEPGAETINEFKKKIMIY